MRIRSIFSFAFISCVAFAVISCDDDKNGTDSDKPACDETTVLSCASETAKNVCKGGEVVEEACQPNQICQDNSCKNAERDNLAGDTCTIDVCYKNIPHYCNKISGKLEIQPGDHPDCGDGMVCEVTDEINAFCLKTCDTEGEHEYVCGQNQIQEYSANALCKKFPDEKLALYVDESNPDNTEICEEGCLNGHCLDEKPTTADQGKTCDVSTYGYHCDQNKLVFCNSFSVVDVSDCESIGRECKTDSNDAKNSACIDTSATCETVGETTYSCEEAGYEDSYDTLNIRVCTKATDDNKYLFGDSKKCDIGTFTEDGGCVDY